jgi:hypothetical protein
LYWWPRQAYSFQEAAELCAGYGGGLAVLAASTAAQQAEAMSNLTQVRWLQQIGVLLDGDRARVNQAASTFRAGVARYGIASCRSTSVVSTLRRDSGFVQVEYWIGLLNAVGEEGPNGTWTWVDQSSYDPAGAQWAAGQPAEGSNCAYIKWQPELLQWRWFGGVCTAPRAALCSLPPRGEGPYPAAELSLILLQDTLPVCDAVPEL